jgi:hypothetical protein
VNDTDLAALVRDAVRDAHMTVPESDITRRARRRGSPPRRGRRRGERRPRRRAGRGDACRPRRQPADGQVRNAAQLTAWTVTKEPGGGHRCVDPRAEGPGRPAGATARGRPAVLRHVRQPGCKPDWPHYRYFLEHPHAKPRRIVTITPTT